MVFSSVVFIFFFLPISLATYYLVRHEFRNALLLLLSLIFYFWGEGKYVTIMIFFMIFNYLAGRIIEHFSNRRVLSFLSLSVALSINLAVLIYFKYIAFFLTNLNRFSEIFQATFSIPETHLPIGISFFSFQAISYIVDVYRKEVKSQKNIIDFSMYKAFFPQLIAGPIVRYRDIANQIRGRVHTSALFLEGFNRFSIGLAKKVLIANNLAGISDAMFRLPDQDLSTTFAWFGLLCYTLQIYFDFSGYSDMAIGLAKMFGFEFLENFNYPYVARSIKEFWRRWHISLSTWFRDYVYVSFGGNRVGRYNRLFNLLLVFLLCGLWHGASWTFIVWGAWHGLFLIIERTAFGQFIARLPHFLGIIYTIVVVALGWVFFRADSMHHAYHIFKSLFFLQPGTTIPFTTPERSVVFAVLIGIIGITPIFAMTKKRLLSIDSTGSIQIVKLLELLFAFSILVLSAAFLANATYNPFIYFKF